ncbi:glycine zipper family protein [Sagittula sp. S175]|uniref:glycine zipper family protein n=1 Tax=Sagittula sp. S175 TaxID=3415129 RepID=UPI003C7B3812
MKPLLLLTAAAIGLTACADSGANYRPILDGAPSAAFQSDLAACQTLARDQRQFDQETAGAAVMGAGAGALLGELDDDGDALGGAVAGALAGGIAGAVNASERREAIVVECLRGRGHRVVG